MRGILYIILTTLVFFAPVERLDVAKLEPIEAVAVEAEGETVILKTDTGRQGRGESVEEALKDLKQNTPAVVYLDTAQFLLISEAAGHLEGQITQYFKPSVRLAPYHGGDVKEELQYLQAHMDKAKPIV